ncbi:MAG: lytic transglycosylase domain-containing protein [Caldisericota bacterium]|nr:lytic transglycosylase domain-containing protein [Caldisericota bacterium]
MKLRFLLVALFVFGSAAAHSSARPDRCIEPAAQTHRVNADILRAILMIESRMNPSVVTRNSNGSIDVGIAGINSIHFKELSRFGITERELMDPCVSTFVAAWKVSRKIAKWGNTWFAIAAYHSETPYFNGRYQIMLFNEMVRAGVVRGTIQNVPPLRRPKEIRK